VPKSRKLELYQTSRKGKSELILKCTVLFNYPAVKLKRKKLTKWTTEFTHLICRTRFKCKSCTKSISIATISTYCKKAQGVAPLGRIGTGEGADAGAGLAVFGILHKLWYFRYRNQGISLTFKVSYTIISELMLENRHINLFVYRKHKWTPIYANCRDLAKKKDNFSQAKKKTKNVKQLFTKQSRWVVKYFK